jgi:hypothetical protein
MSQVQTCANPCFQLENEIEKHPPPHIQITHVSAHLQCSFQRGCGLQGNQGTHNQSFKPEEVPLYTIRMSNSPLLTLKTGSDLRCPHIKSTGAQEPLTVCPPSKRAALDLTRVAVSAYMWVVYPCTTASTHPTSFAGILLATTYGTGETRLTIPTRKIMPL